MATCRHKRCVSHELAGWLAAPGARTRSLRVRRQILMPALPPSSAAQQLLEKKMKGHAGKSHFDSADWAKEVSKVHPPSDAASSGMDQVPEGGGQTLSEGQTMRPPDPSTKS